jgi:hypothetical protein
MHALKLAAVLALVLTSAAEATPPPPPPPAATGQGKLGIDTPINELMADARTRKIMDRHLPGVKDNPHYAMIEGMSLRELAPMSQGKLTPETLAKIEAELKAVQ